ncbi:unnamed protein product [Albugo candida]|uniref:RxLR effector protein n=1 Tax=Albugo candida TaxID=65357 RepID=A0A024GFG8_9STRA|nr:unnamed protein product [Albugo candida]|eukprot:CCI45087.1 unnamed protein product [Albugo candida]
MQSLTKALFTLWYIAFYATPSSCEAQNNIRFESNDVVLTKPNTSPHTSKMTKSSEPSVNLIPPRNLMTDILMKTMLLNNAVQHFQMFTQNLIGIDHMAKMTAQQTAQQHKQQEQRDEAVSAQEDVLG